MGGRSSRYITSFGPAMTLGQLAGATCITGAICYIQHQSVLTSGLQPTTTSGEWEAASVRYRLNHTLESSEDKTFVCDPIRNTMPDAESGRAVKWSTYKHLKNKWDP